MIKPLLTTAAAVALLALAACNNSNKAEEVDTVAPDPMASAVANAAPIELPPAIEASVTFRCQPGNALVFVDFYQGGTKAGIKLKKDDMPTMLTAPAAGQPYVAAGGYKITGDAKGATVEAPGLGSKTCKA
jgi:hypothetical protein